MKKIFFAIVCICVCFCAACEKNSNENSEKESVTSQSGLELPEDKFD